MDATGARQRARRFPIQTVVHYRAVGEEGWREGRTDNISESGILFQTAQVLPTNTRIEMRLTLPVAVAGLRTPEIVCRGRVVRSLPPDSSRPVPALAATITVYRIKREGNGQPAA